MRCLNKSILRGQLLASPHAEKLARLMSGEATYPCCFPALNSKGIQARSYCGFEVGHLALLRVGY